MNGQMTVVPVERIERAILSIRGEKVMLDSDLAVIYGVPTKVLNQAVKRNLSRFPPDFMFQLPALHPRIPTGFKSISPAVTPQDNQETNPV